MYSDGQLNRRNMRAARVSDKDLRESVRQCINEDDWGDKCNKELGNISPFGPVWTSEQAYDPSPDLYDYAQTKNVIAFK